MKVAFFLSLVAQIQAQVACVCDYPITSNCNSCYWSPKATLAQQCRDWDPNKKTDLKQLNSRELDLFIQQNKDDEHFDREKVFGLTAAEMDCYGRGNFNYSTELCTCNAVRASVTNYCQTCLQGYVDYPLCLEGCNLKQCQPSSRCESLASAAASQSCPTVNNAGQLFSPSTDLCCPDLDNPGYFNRYQNALADGRKCCGNNVCNWDEECQEFKGYKRDDLNIIQEQTKYKCFDKTKRKTCEQWIYDVDSKKWWQDDLVSIEKWQSCCGASDVCGSNEACVEHATDDPFPNTEIRDGFKTSPAQYGSNARLNWVRPPLPGEDPTNKKTQLKVGQEMSKNNGKKSFRKKCVPYKIQAGTAVYAGVLPTMLILVTLVGAGLVISAAGIGSVKVFVPALLVIVSSCTLYFSRAWSSGLLAVLGAFMAIGAQAGSSENKHVFSVIVQFFIFCAICGNMGLGALFSNSTTFFGSAADYNGVLEIQRCYRYFDYFNNNNNQPWNHEEPYERLCSRDWLSATLFFSAVLVAFFFLQLVASASLMAGDK